jgi:hypothetical protein
MVTCKEKRTNGLGIETETVRRSRLLLIFFKVGAGDYIGEKEGVEHGNQQHNNRYRWHDNSPKNHAVGYAGRDHYID